jgi:hypothetical protein
MALAELDLLAVVAEAHADSDILTVAVSAEETFDSLHHDTFLAISLSVFH